METGGSKRAPRLDRGGSPHVDALIFDAEGVIIDTEPVWDEGQRVFLARRNVEYERERVKPHLTGRSLEDGTRALMDIYDIAGDVETLARERADIVRELMPEVGFVSGFPQFFETVRSDYRTCVASAMADDLFDVVDRSLGIRRLFEDRVYLLSDVGFRSKPNPALFLHAAEAIETPPPACVVIEDAPHGIAAAHLAGMRAIGLTTTYRPELLAEADLIADSYDELDLSRISRAPAP